MLRIIYKNKISVNYCPTAGLFLAEKQKNLSNLRTGLYYNCYSTTLATCGLTSSTHPRGHYETLWGVQDSSKWFSLNGNFKNTYVSINDPNYNSKFFDDFGYVSLTEKTIGFITFLNQAFLFIIDEEGL